MWVECRVEVVGGMEARDLGKKTLRACVRDRWGERERERERNRNGKRCGMMI